MQRSRMGSIAAANLREHRNSFTAVFVTVFSAALLVCALGVLFESGIRGGVTPHRLSGADVVVGAPQALDITEDVDQPYVERARLPESTVAELSALPGVGSAVGPAVDPAVVLTPRWNHVCAAAGRPFASCLRVRPHSPGHRVGRCSAGVQPMPSGSARR